MRIKATQKLIVEDFPDQKSWIAKLISPLNNYILQSIKIINDGIIFPDNFVGVDHLFEFTYQSDALTLPMGFSWNIGIPPKALQVVSALENNSPVNISVAWGYTQSGQVRLTSIVKFTSAPAVATLTASSQYKIRVRVTP